jgi:expansin (peptidoglycan-binding protein)
MAATRLAAGLAVGTALTVALGVGVVYAGRNVIHGSVRAKTARFDASAQGATCSVRYVVQTEQQGLFTADLELQGIQWLGTWHLAWEYGVGQQLQQVVGAAWQQRGTRVTVRGGQARARGAGGSVRLWLQGRFSGVNRPPSGFTLNGTPCTSNTPRASTTRTPPSSSPTISITAGSPPSRHSSIPTSPSLRTQPPTRAPAPARTSTSISTTSRPVPSRVLGTGRLQFGRTHSGEATHYGATGEGNCLLDRSSDLMVAAMNATEYENSQACGAYIEVTGPRGTVTVKIVDQCPGCKPGDIDFSPQTFARIADPVAGRVRISWRLLSPALRGPVAYRYKEGSNQWWCGIQVRGHRNPVRTMESLVNGGWQRLARQSYNYFVSPDGSGCGKPLRITDIYGNQLTERKPVPISVGVVQPGSGQFGPPR